MFPNPQDALPLPPRSNLEQYKKLAKELVKAYKSPGPDAIHAWAKRWVESLVRLQGLEITREMPVRVDHWIDKVKDFAQRELEKKCTLSQAQFVIARAEGFESWPKLAKYIQELERANSAASRFEAAADAIVNGDMATLQRLLREDPKLAQMRSTREHRATLLHYVSANGVEGYRQKTPKNIVRIAELLLKAGAEVDAECDVYGGGATTLGLTATSCHPEAAGVQNELLQLLLDHGAALDHSKAAGNRHRTVRGCLANGRFQAAKFLAERGAPLDLEEAAGIGRLDLVKSFFNSDGSMKPNATKEQMQDGFNWASESGQTDVIRFLLEKEFPVDIHLKPNGQTALHWAAYGGHVEIVKLLLERKAPVNTKDERFGGTPLGWALYGWGESPNRGNYYEVVRLLVDAGATVKPEWLADPNREMPITEKIHADPQMLASLKDKASELKS